MDNVPIPARLVAPWLEDNAKFIQSDLAFRKRRLDEMKQKRDELISEGRIRSADHTASRVKVSAVDAAIADVPFGDMVSILLQVVHVADDGKTTTGAPKRATGVNGHELQLARTPMRVAAECAVLAEAETITIADTSFWSLLMEVNQAITRKYNSSSDNNLADAVDTLTSGGLFLRAVSNSHVIAMSKSSQSSAIGGDFASDREALGQILKAGDFVKPRKLAKGEDGGTEGRFGIEKRGFNEAERREVRDLYERLGVVFYKPHSWSRAFRIEAQLHLLNDNAWLMPLLAAIRHHTTTRTIAEPWPQFMADWTAKQISGVSKLYGELNFHRSPFIDPARTGRRV